jgi:hypothetical protein
MACLNPSQYLQLTLPFGAWTERTDMASRDDFAGVKPIAKKLRRMCAGVHSLRNPKRAVAPAKTDGLGSANALSIRSNPGTLGCHGVVRLNVSDNEHRTPFAAGNGLRIVTGAR